MNFKNKSICCITRVIQAMSMFLSTLCSENSREKIYTGLFWTCIGCIIFIFIALFKFSLSKINNEVNIYFIIGLMLFLCTVFYISYYIKYYIATYYKLKLENIAFIVLSLSDLTNRIIIKSNDIEKNIQNQYNNFEHNFINTNNNFNEFIDDNRDIIVNAEHIHEQCKILSDMLKEDSTIIKHCTDIQKIGLWRMMLDNFKKVNNINIDIIDRTVNLTRNNSLYVHIDALLMFIEGKTYTDINNKYPSLNISRSFSIYIHDKILKFSQLYPFLPDIFPLLEKERLKRRKKEKTE